VKASVIFDVPAAVAFGAAMRRGASISGRSEGWISSGLQVLYAPTYFPAGVRPATAICILQRALNSPNRRLTQLRTLETVAFSVMQRRRTSF
jgi:hypothetical protein